MRARDGKSFPALFSVPLAAIAAIILWSSSAQAYLMPMQGPVVDSRPIVTPIHAQSPYPPPRGHHFMATNHDDNNDEIEMKSTRDGDQFFTPSFAQRPWRLAKIMVREGRASPGDWLAPDYPMGGSLLEQDGYFAADDDNWRVEDKTDDVLTEYDNNLADGRQSMPESLPMILSAGPVTYLKKSLLRPFPKKSALHGKLRILKKRGGSGTKKSMGHLRILKRAVEAHRAMSPNINIYQELRQGLNSGLLRLTASQGDNKGSDSVSDQDEQKHPEPESEIEEDAEDDKESKTEAPLTKELIHYSSQPTRLFIDPIGYKRDSFAGKLRILKRKFGQPSVGRTRLLTRSWPNAAELFAGRLRILKRQADMSKLRILRRRRASPQNGEMAATTAIDSLNDAGLEGAERLEDNDIYDYGDDFIEGHYDEEEEADLQESKRSSNNYQLHPWERSSLDAGLDHFWNIKSMGFASPGGFILKKSADESAFRGKLRIL